MPGEPGVDQPIRVRVSRDRLTRDERLVLAPDLESRGIAPSMLDVIPPAGRHFQLVRAEDPEGRLLGVTSLMSVPPFVSIKQFLGEGNHVGWDSSIYYSQGADRPRVAAAILRAMARRTFFYGIFFGRIDDDVRSALPRVGHRLLETDYRLGRIDTSRFTDVLEFLAGHKRLRRHLRDHARAGGTVHVHEGPVDAGTAARFSELVLATYRHHGGIGRWQFGEYAREVCGSFFTTCADAVHIFTKRDGRITGLQTFVCHRHRIELAEGGFEQTTDNHHAYEAIIAESVAYAVRNRLDAVGFGGIWNAGKDRYTDTDGRDPVYLLQIYGGPARYRLFGDRISQWAFRWYFGGRFEGASSKTTVISRRQP